MDTKWKSEEKKINQGRIWGVLLILLFAVTAGVIMMSQYPKFREKSGITFWGNEEENTEDMRTQGDVPQVFVAEESFLNYLTSAVYYLDFMTTPETANTEYFSLSGESYPAEEMQWFAQCSEQLMMDIRDQVESNASVHGYYYHCSGVEMMTSNSYGDLHALAEGRGYYSESERAEIQNNYDAGMVIYFDASGEPTIETVWNMDYSLPEVREALEPKSFRELMVLNGLLHENYQDSGNGREILDEVTVPLVKNKVFVFVVGENEEAFYAQNYWEEVGAIQQSGYLLGAYLILGAMALLALVLQNVKPLYLKDMRIFHLPTEFVVVAESVLLIWIMDYIPTDIAVETVTNMLPEAVLAMGVSAEMVATVTHGIIASFWTLYALAVYWAVATLLPYIAHPIKTLVNNSFLLRFCRFIFRKLAKLWKQMTEVKLGKKLEWMVLLAVLGNWLINTLLCHLVALWNGGPGFFASVMVPLAIFFYNLGIYIFARYMVYKAINDYHCLYEKAKRVAGGDFEKQKEETLGLYSEIGEQLDEIEVGFRKAVSEEVKSKNMKTELITNVSHDLKTPLTAIITYIELLKKEENSEKEREEYLRILEQKANRLKVLIEDLFEVSKAESDNIVLNYANVDLVSLLKEVSLENERKISESTLDIRFHYGMEKCILRLDPARTYRIMDNLMQNILKYAMENTRVYIELVKEAEEVRVCFKNISAVEMNFSPEEITERFVRGDLSRNSEGSGLGLAIAQSFTQLQGGTFRVETDGDLFKVTVTFPWKEEKTEDIGGQPDIA